MQDRRAAVRKRVLYGAIAATAADGRRYTCIVKNWSDLGARVEFTQRAELTDEVSLILTKTGVAYSARVAWSNDNAVGLAFTSAPATAYVPKSALDHQMRDTKEAASAVHRRVNAMLGES